MSTVTTQAILSDGELRERVEAFQAGPRTMDHAADCGLLALPVSPVFGGFGCPTEQYLTAYGTLTRLKSPPTVIGDLIFHWSVCGVIDREGTYSQYDLLLPQLAAGKRIGVWTHYFGSTDVTIRAERTENGYTLHGDTLALSEVSNKALVSLFAWLDGIRRIFIVPAPALPSGTLVKHNRVYYTLRDCVVSRYTLLGGDNKTPPDNEKWRAIRWKTAPSES